MIQTSIVKERELAAIDEREPSATVACPRVSRTQPRSHVTGSCSDCVLRMLCLPTSMAPEEIHFFEQVVLSRRRLHRGEHVYRAGEPFKYLYAFRSGFFKTYVDGPDGQSHVIAFPMAGDVAGLDGIETEDHRFNVVALDDGEACIIPFVQFESVAMSAPALQHQLHKLMSREIVREQELMTLLSGMRAEARVAAFLLALSDKFAARGYSPTQFLLRMTREDVGSYLGLKLETVSRVLSGFQRSGLISMQLRSIAIVDVSKLAKLVPNL